MSFVGKFVQINGEDYYRNAEVIEQITPDVYLLRDIDDDKILPVTFLIHLGELLSSINIEGELQTNTFVFNSREELDAWMEWLETPSEKKNPLGANVITFEKKDV